MPARTPTTPPPTTATSTSSPTTQPLGASGAMRCVAGTVSLSTRISQLVETVQLLAAAVVTQAGDTEPAVLEGRVCVCPLWFKSTWEP